MKRFLFVLCSLSIFSCNFLESKEERMQKLIDQELSEMDWNTVDSYPLFASCDETAPKALQKECFEQVLTTHFENTLNEFEFVIDGDENEMVEVVFVIDTVGKISIVNINKDATVLNQMPEFEGVISQSLKNIPEIAPAIKRGIPVNTKFRIPIQLNIK